jgi:organic radical activating enzyme
MEKNDLVLHQTGKFYINDVLQEGNWKLSDITDKIDVLETTTLKVSPHALCTNACAHCDEHSSSRWAKLQEIETLKDITYNDSTTLLTVLLENLTNLCTVTFDGGDPLYIVDSHLDTLKSIPNKENIELRYYSSLKTMPHEDIIEIWQEFKHVKIFVSLDTSEKYFSYFRFGSNWYSVIETIETLREHAEIIATITVNCLTMMDMYPLVEYIVDNDLQLQVTFVNPPHQMSCVFIPNDLKRNAVLQLTRCLQKVKKYEEEWKTERATQELKKIQEFMFSHYESDAWHPETLNFFASLDSIYSGFRIYDISDGKIIHPKQKAKLKK